MQIRNLCWLLIVAILVTAPCMAAAPQSSLQWAERMLARASVPPTSRDWPEHPRAALLNAVKAFDSIVSKYGPSAQAFLGMARAEILLGNYLAAFRLVEQAEPLMPDKSAAERLRLEIGRLMEISETAGTLLPQAPFVLRVTSYPAPGQANLWAVLSANNEPSPYGGYTRYTNVLLTLFRGSDRNLQKVWQSGPLGATGITSGEFNDLQIYVLDINGDKTPDIVIPEVLIAASTVPSHLDVFTWRRGHLMQILDLSSEFPVQLRDLDNDGRYEALSTHSIGWTPAHVEQPQWIDVYAYRTGMYRLADLKYPQQYKALATQIKQSLASHPNYFELLGYSAIVNQILGQGRTARSQYSRAQNAYRATLSAEPDAQRRALIQTKFREIQCRWTAVGGAS